MVPCTQCDPIGSIGRQISIGGQWSSTLNPTPTAGHSTLTVRLCIGLCNAFTDTFLDSNRFKYAHTSQMTSTPTSTSTISSPFIPPSTPSTPTIHVNSIPITPGLPDSYRIHPIQSFNNPSQTPDEQHQTQYKSSTTQTLGDTIHFFISMSSKIASIFFHILTATSFRHFWQDGFALTFALPFCSPVLGVSALLMVVCHLLFVSLLLFLN